MTILDFRELRIRRDHRAPIDAACDRGIALMLALLVVTRLGARSEIETYHAELEQRAVDGAKQGDC